MVLVLLVLEEVEIAGQSLAVGVEHQQLMLEVVSMFNSLFRELEVLSSWIIVSCVTAVSYIVALDCMPYTMIDSGRQGTRRRRVTREKIQSS